MAESNWFSVPIEDYVKDIVNSQKLVGEPAPQATEKEVETMFCNMDRDSPCEVTIRLGDIPTGLHPSDEYSVEIDRLERLLDQKQIEILKLQRENTFYKELLDGDKK